MLDISNAITSYMHTYEAYRVPKGTAVKDSTDEEVVLSEEEDTLVLTEDSTKQLMKDREKFTEMLANNANMAASKSQNEALKKILKDQAKALEVYRNLAHGDIVPPSDERKLMDYDPKLYQAAKMAQVMAQRMKEKIKKRKSEWDEKEEQADKERQDLLNAETAESIEMIGTGTKEFIAAQESSIVEIDAGNTDFSSLQTCNIGNITGSFCDFSV